MSNITTVYSTILSTVATLFPTKVQIPNPYELTENNRRFLENGYGVKMGSADIDPQEFNTYTYDQNISVVLTREVLKTDENIAAIETATTAMLEDIHTLRKDFCNSDQLGIEINIAKIDLGSSTGLEFIDGDKFNFVNMEVNFIFSIQEII